MPETTTNNRRKVLFLVASDLTLFICSLIRHNVCILQTEFTSLLATKPTFKLNLHAITTIQHVIQHIKTCHDLTIVIRQLTAQMPYVQLCGHTPSVQPTPALTVNTIEKITIIPMT